MASDRILGVLIPLLGFFFRAIPMTLALAMARGMARFIFWSDPKRKFIGFANLAQAFGDSLSIEERIRILEGVYQNLGQSLVEILRFPRLSRERLHRDIEVQGLEKLHKVFAQGKGLIALTAHFGNWELIRMAIALNGVPLNVVAREQKMTRVNRLLNRYRELGGCGVITKGMNLRVAYRSLAKNQLVGMLIDQDGGKQGVFAPLLGRKASTKPGAFILSLRTGAPLIPIFILRDPKEPHKHKIIFEDPLTSPRSDEEIPAVAAQYLAILERYIRKAPDQWLWLHKRWKSSPLWKIVILDDGKKGHLKQSLAAAKLNDVLKQAGDLQGPLEQQVIGIRFKSRIRSFLGSLLLVGLPWSLSWRWKVLQWSVSPESYRELASTKGEIVISAGSSLSAVNFWLAKAWNAKNIHLMRPNLVPWKGFWRILLPLHDWHSDQPAPRNVILTPTPPNLVKEELKIAAMEFRNKIPTSLAKIGVLLGGDTAGYRMTQGWVQELLYYLIKVAQENDKRLLITTSRRTPKAIDQMLKEDLKDHPLCEFLEIANESSQNGVVPSILGLSETLVVTGDSISMVSEAASSGKRVFVAFPPRLRWNKRKDKYQRLVESLERQGLVQRVEPDDLVLLL